jgi:hypothetical protein
MTDTVPNVCSTCRFWGGSFSYIGTPWGESEGESGGKVCRLTMTDYDDQVGGYGPGGPPMLPIEKPSLALSRGDRGGWLETSPSFSCNQWEKR